jgi:hypothetical protein
VSGHAPLAPDELAQALTVYRERGTYAAAAAAVGRDPSTIRKALRRHEAPERAALFAEELEQAHANALRATRKARRKALAALADATDPRDIALMAHVCHDGLRAVTTARTAHARIVGNYEEVASRVGEELRGALERLKRALPPEMFERVRHALADDELAGSPVHGVVVEYDANLAVVPVGELHRRVAALVASMHGDALASVEGLTAEELEARLRAGLTSLVRRAREGDDEARALLAPLVDATRVPEGVPVVYLPREEQP